jgi:hypothetical protein
MRSVFAGFALGYLAIAFLAAPVTLCGVIMPIRSRLEQAVQMRDKLMDELGDYLGNKFFPSRVVAD